MFIRAIYTYMYVYKNFIDFLNIPSTEVLTTKYQITHENNTLGLRFLIPLPRYLLQI